MSKAVIKEVQEALAQGLKSLWDEEIDSLAVGMGEPDSIADKSRIEVCAAIMKRMEAAVLRGMGEQGEQGEQGEKEKEKGMGELTKGMKKMRVSVQEKEEIMHELFGEEGQSKEDFTKMEKMRKKMEKMEMLSPYKVFCSTVLKQWRMDNPKADLPEGGEMGLVGPLWKVSFMNQAADEFDKKKRDEVMRKVNCK